MNSYLWLSFFVIVALLLAFDLGFARKESREISVKESLVYSLGYFLISCVFGAVISLFVDGVRGENFFTGYFVEKSLSIDNIFAISMVFSHFSIPRIYQHRVLALGIIGAIIMRGVMIFLGVEIVEKFHFVLYFFGGVLILTGMKMFFAKHEEKSLEENKLLNLIKKYIPVTEKLHGNKFFVHEKSSKEGKTLRKATPLFLVLVFVELADVIFAVDSVPAVLAITTDTFVVYSSNIFAILGLRSLYFALAAMLHRFACLKYSLAVVLIFIGGKIFLNSVINIPSLISLLVTLLLLAAGVVVSLYKTRV